MFSGVTVHSGVLFVTQRGNTSLDPVIALSTASGALHYTFGAHNIAQSPDKSTWGAHGIASAALANGTRIYVNDFNRYTLTAFDLVRPADMPVPSLSVGTPFVPGVGNDPVQFGKLADTAIGGPGAARGTTRVYVSDGDGGDANRVVALEVSDGDSMRGPSYALAWATPQFFHNPHSIALHPRTGLLLVADREHARLRLLFSVDGIDLGTLECGLRLGVQPDGKAYGVPFGVRFYSSSDQRRDLAFVAIMDNPQDGRNQRIAVLDVSGFEAGAGTGSPSPTACKLVQEIHVPTSDSGPHLLGVDHDTGDLYAALVAPQPRSWVLRYKPS